MAADRWEDLKLRTKKFALRIMALSRALPKSVEGREIGRQILRAGMSVGANFREATRARSGQEFAAKSNIALMELEETKYWLELIEESKLMSADRLKLLLRESNELTAIFVTIIKNAKR